ncbi:MAG: glutamine--fructose-6-phosphate transaminase (isomerizing) [Chthoniobacterales bacterium]|nr:glutamine--fructose-6-phosphate transaminase (isomerizing) [Chthoniobacterales bacterium]
MCGIVGYIGSAEAAPVLLDGLRRLEYRGYDSAGVALGNNGSLEIRKAVGRIQNLAQVLGEHPVHGNRGISHTRWATHGAVTAENAHPHTDQSGRIVLVHNGVIENYQRLREELEREGHVFQSETDTEVLAHLIGKHAIELGEPSADHLVQAVRMALREVQGTYGIAVMHRDVPDLLIGARRGSPLVVGVGKGENFLASDVSAIVNHTRDVVYLKDFEIVVLRPDRFEVQSLAGGGRDYEISTVDFDAGEVSKGDYPHYMLKEIYEQASTVRDAMRGRLSREEATAKLGGLNMTSAQLREVERIVLIGCGTAYHAALVGEYLMESLASLPTEVEVASEFRYRNMPLDKFTLSFVISQSGETADTLAALRESQRKGHRTLGICNNVASTIARDSDGGVYMHAGPEIGVAATKSFTSQVTILTLLSLLMGRIRNLSSSDGLRFIDELEQLPDKVARVLEMNPHLPAVAEKYANSHGMLFMGRQFQYPVALEAALKLKEISYMFCSGYPSAELKHGVIALVNPDTPSVFIAPRDALFEKNASNIHEVRARKGPVIGVGTEGHEALAKITDDTLWVPDAPDWLMPVLTVIPLQLLAYHIAVVRGCDVDKPRNLAKSVTVE